MVDFKALVPWTDKSRKPAQGENLLDPLLSFRREINHLFDDVFRDLGRSAIGTPVGAWAASMPSVRHQHL